MRDECQTSEFVQLLTSHQRQLYLYILTHLPYPADAEEVLQETNVVLWAESSKFIPGSQFFAWAQKVAHFQVLTFRKRGQRDRLTFSDELLATIASEVSAESPRQDDRRLALTRCLDKLSARDRDLIARRYGTNTSVQQVAHEVGRPQSSIYRSLERVRVALLACIQRSLTSGERGA